MAKYKINGEYELEAESRLGLLEQIIIKETIKIEEIKSTSGKMEILSQRNKKWKDLKLGNSKLTVGEYGCVITCISMFSSWYGEIKYPDYLAKKLKYTPSGLLYWSSMDSKTPMKFVRRYYSRNDKKIKEILYSKNNACILQVNNGKHWVALIGYSKLYGYKIADPIDARVVWLKHRYTDITGFTEVTRNN